MKEGRLTVWFNPVRRRATLMPIAELLVRWLGLPDWLPYVLVWMLAMR